MFNFTCIFVCFTLLLTFLASLFLHLSLFSDEWEYISYEPEVIEGIALARNDSVQWLPGQLARIELMETPSTANDSQNTSHGGKKTVIYLVPAHGGVNNLCAEITESAREMMVKEGYTPEECISYLSNEKVISKDSWLDRMRNLAMSCAMVSLILLGTSAFLGILGLIKKQISTIMVTGVMYILAAIFGVFNLIFMRFKRVKADGFYTSTVLDLDVPEEYMRARTFTSGWPLSMEWAGLFLCLLAGLFWQLLAKILSASIFGVFNLIFMRFKRVKADGFYSSTVLDLGVPDEYMRARTFTSGWPLSMEWAGLCLCLLASLFWLLLAKIFRFIVLSPTLQ